MVDQAVRFVVADDLIRCRVEVDRRQAIAMALETAGPDDVVVVAGKGHETVQEIGGQLLDFDDREVVRELLGLLPPEQQGGALGLLGAVFGLAFLIGPVLGGLLLDYGWQWLFLINVPIAVLLIFGAWQLLPKGTLGEAHKVFDGRGAVTLSVGLATLAIAITNFDASQPVHFCAGASGCVADCRCNSRVKT